MYINGGSIQIRRAFRLYVCSLRNSFATALLRVSIHRIGFVQGAWLLLLCTILNLPQALAQELTRKAQKQSMERSFKSVNKLSVTAGGGVSIVRSDQDGVKSSLVQLIKSKGIGQSVSLGAVYQVSPYVGLYSRLEYDNLKGYPDKNEVRSGKGCSYCTELLSLTKSVIVYVSNAPTLLRFYNTPFRDRLVVLPYVRAGIGIMRFSSSSYKAGRKELSATEYPSMAAVIPVGGGLKFKLTDHFSFSTDLVLNFTTSDYLDNRVGKNTRFGSTDQFVSASMMAFYTPTKRNKRLSRFK